MLGLGEKVLLERGGKGTLRNGSFSRFDTEGLGKTEEKLRSAGKLSTTKDLRGRK
jgi:hypothetical protein